MLRVLRWASLLWARCGDSLEWRWLRGILASVILLALYFDRYSAGGWWWLPCSFTGAWRYCRRTQRRGGGLFGLEAGLGAYWRALKAAHGLLRGVPGLVVILAVDFSYPWKVIVTLETKW